MKVATSLVLGKLATQKLAADAVANAMEKANITIANSVLLFLTSEFANNPLPAIKAAAKAAKCTQVMGCSATGIFTEDDWVIDTPAAAAMVFGDDLYLQLPSHNYDQQPLLTLSAPNAIDTTWLNHTHVRYGGVSGDATGHGPFSVWQNAKGHVSGHIEAFISGVEVATRASHGLQLLTDPQCVNQVNQFDMSQLGQKNALKSLQKAWRLYSKTKAPVPLHLVMAVYADAKKDIHEGNYNQTTVISLDEDNSSITLAHTLQPGQFLSWAIRDVNAAEKDMLYTAKTLEEQLDKFPDFGLLFSCLGRGPYFYEGSDLDLKIITQNYPKMPLLGFYGNGEIAHINHRNQLLPYSAVLSLFARKTEHLSP